MEEIVRFFMDGGGLWVGVEFEVHATDRGSLRQASMAAFFALAQTFVCWREPLMRTRSIFASSPMRLAIPWKLPGLNLVSLILQQFAVPVQEVVMN